MRIPSLLPIYILKSGYREAGLVAKHAEERKQAKYRHLVSSHIFVPVAVETSGVFGTEAL